MQAEATTSLNESREFLRDAMALSHEMIKARLKALRAGEQIDWRETASILREGRTCARQLTQIATLEFRAEQAAQPRRSARKAPVKPAGFSITPEMASAFLDGMLKWQMAMRDHKGPDAPPMPDELTSLIQQLGLDPADPHSIEDVLEIFEGYTGALRGAA